MQASLVGKTLGSVAKMDPLIAQDIGSFQASACFFCVDDAIILSLLIVNGIVVKPATGFAGRVLEKGSTLLAKSPARNELQRNNAVMRRK